MTMNHQTSELDHIWAFFHEVYQNERSAADHPPRLTALAQSDDEIAVALLHDVIEDDLASKERVADLLGGMDDPRMQAVLTLARNKSTETYEVYVQRVIDSGNPLAIAVKMYDLFDHIMPNRLGNIGPSHAKKYTDALQQIALSLCATEDGVRNKG
jgi:hypothetical protein